MPLEQMQHPQGPARLFDLTPFAESFAKVIETVGIATIVLGAVLATIGFLYGLYRTRTFSGRYHEYRSQLGRAILLGLEFLVAADIIGTVAVEPTLDNLGVLGLIVVIRTFLSFSLQVEIEGRLPWQKKREGGKV